MFICLPLLVAVQEAAKRRRSVARAASPNRKKSAAPRRPKCRSTPTSRPTVYAIKCVIDSVFIESSFYLGLDDLLVSTEPSLGFSYVISNLECLADINFYWNLLSVDGFIVALLRFQSVPKVHAWNLS